MRDDGRRALQTGRWWAGWVRMRVLVSVAWLMLAGIGVPVFAHMAPLFAWLLPALLPWDDSKRANRTTLAIILTRLAAVGTAELWTAHDYPGYLGNPVGRRLGPFKPHAAEIGQQLAVGALGLLVLVELCVAFYYWRRSRPRPGDQRFDPPRPGIAKIVIYPWDEPGAKPPDPPRTTGPT